MGKRRIALISLALTLVVWTVFTWPLPRKLFEAIPCATMHAPLPSVTVFMQSGDHLQLMYHFWMFRDMVTGGTPWFAHMYEFNTGSDEERFEPGSYYFPFSGVYAIGSLLVNDAFGWNLAGFVSLWVTVFFTWLLVLRYNSSHLIAAALGVLAISLPYRWYSLLGGSPSGFAMGLVPALLLGLDIAVRERRLAGGVLAGVAIMFCAWTDMQVFFFATLAIPAWCLFAFLSALPGKATWFRDLSRQALCLSPVPFGVGAGYLTAKLMTRNIEKTHAGGGRTIREVALFSPRPDGIFSEQSLGTSNHIFLGYAIVALIAVALVVALIHVHRQGGWRTLGLFAVLLGGTFVVVGLSMGPFGFFDGRFFTAARKFLPEYDMIRQPAKVYCLVPSLLAVTAAIGFSAVAGRVWLRWLAPALGLAAALQCAAQFSPVLCVLDTPSPAYRAVVDDAKAQGKRPHAIVIPLWPGDSHQTSVYQYYSTFERLRLVNGYLPFVPKNYIKDIFHRFRSINVGHLNDVQLDELLQRGISHVILHEDMFPEKVSPFAVTYTLRQLLNNPRLQKVAQDESIWAFRILASPDSRTEPVATWAYSFPASLRDIENMRGLRNVKIVEEPTAHRGKFVRFAETGATGNVGIEWIGPSDDLRWRIRCRGTATLEWIYQVNGQKTVMTQSVDAAEWTWIEMPVPELTTFSEVLLDWVVVDGTFEADCTYLAAGPSIEVARGSSVILPAPNFFHAGHIDNKTDEVVFDPISERRGIVFYGPKLPVGTGDFSVSVEASSDAPAGAKLGFWVVASPEGTELARADHIAGQPVVIPFTLSQDLPLLIAFSYEGAGPMRVKSLTIERR